MELETIRCVVAGLGDGTIGINALIAALTLEAGDARPPNLTIYNSVQHGWVARKAFALSGLNVTLPALAVFASDVEIKDAEVETAVRDGWVTVTLAHLAEKSATETGNYNALQTNRAILRFCKLFSANSNLAMRTRNGVILQAIAEIKPDSIAAVKDDVFIGAATTVKFLVRETSP